MRIGIVDTIGLACLALIAALLMARPADAQATVTFTSAAVAIEQGTPSVDLFGQINNNQANAVSINPYFITFTGTVPSALITAYDAFGPINNLPATVAAGATYPAAGATPGAIDFFTVDTSSLTPGHYSGNLVLTDSNDNALTNPSGFSITVTPEPSSAAVLALGATAIGMLIIRALRRTPG